MGLLQPEIRVASSASLAITARRFRRSECIIGSFFAILLLYAVLLPGAGHAIPRALGTLLAVILIYGFIALADRWRPLPFWNYFRDWLALAWVLYSYRAMDWFAPASPVRRWETQWVAWDHLLLDEWRLRGVVELLGPVMPGVLEIAYALVYGLPVFCVVVLYARRQRSAMDFFLSVYLVGLYLSYLQFPFWPSEPPWTVFPGDLAPNWDTPFRAFNGWVLRGAGIHTSVFPSAHVSGSVAAALAMWAIFPERPALRWGIAVYAALVTLATVYCRYHYTVDALAGIAVGTLAYLLVRGIVRLAENRKTLPREKGN